MKPRLSARTKPRKASSPSRRAFVSARTRKSPPPTAKCEMKTWRIATAAMSRPGAGSSQSGIVHGDLCHPEGLRSAGSRGIRRRWQTLVRRRIEAPQGDKASPRLAGAVNGANGPRRPSGPGRGFPDRMDGSAATPRGGHGSRPLVRRLLPAPRPAPRGGDPGLRDLDLRAPLHDRLPGDGPRGDADPAGRLAPLRGGQLRRPGGARRAAPLRSPLRRGGPRGHRQLRDRPLPGAEGLPLRALPLLQPRAPAQDAPVLREVRGQDDHHRPLRPHRPDVRAVRGRASAR